MMSDSGRCVLMCAAVWACVVSASPFRLSNVRHRSVTGSGCGPQQQHRAPLYRAGRVLATLEVRTGSCVFTRVGCVRSLVAAVSGEARRGGDERELYLCAV